MEFHCAVQADFRALLRLIQDIHQIGVQFFDGVCIAGMERHGNHGAYFGQIHRNHAVIVCHLAGHKLLIICLTPVNLVEFLDFFVCLPD